MKTSESIKELANALCKAQALMTGAKKASNNPFFKSKYSDLSSVMEAISIPFAENGLCFVQGAELDENKIAVKTRIMHSSGEWIESTTQLPPTKNDAQGYGSAITYAKRYGLQALAGVPSIDDDGNEAVKHAIKPKNTPKAALPVKEKQTKKDLKTKWNPTIDTIWQHFQNKDVNGLHEVTNELNPTDKQELWGLLPTEIKQYMVENKEAA